jgi:hypothetical protein
MKLTATITKPYLKSKYEVKIDYADRERYFYPLSVRGIPTRFECTFLLTAKIKALSVMKSIYKSEKFTPKTYTVALDDWE